MSKTPATDDTTTEDTNVTDTNTTDVSTGPDTDDTGTEAAKYRRRLRDTEAERDTLAGQLAVLRDREYDRLATAGNIAPADLRLIHPDPAAFVDDDGNLDPDKVTEAVAAVLADRPHLDIEHEARMERRRGEVVPGEGKIPSVGTPAPTWDDVIRDRKSDTPEHGRSILTS